MKKLLFFLIVICLISCSCASNDIVTKCDDNWGSNAVNYKYIKVSDTKIKIAVVDSGNNSKSRNIATTYNVLDNNENVTDIISHGTSIIYKIIELFPDATIIPIKITNDTENITVDNLVNGIEKSIELNVDIINLSLGTPLDHKRIQEVIKQAQKRGIIIIAAAGNNGMNTLNYPASYNGVISVMARDKNNIDIKSNSDSIDKKSFSAPGADITCGDSIMNGSSISTAYVTALVGILKNINNELSFSNIEHTLISSCRFSTNTSYGMIDYSKAINIVFNKTTDYLHK